MINLALSAIKSQLEGITVSSLPLIEKYGGLVFPVNIPEQIGTTDAGAPIMRDSIVPVACGVNFQACIGQRKYQELVPNSAYRSIAYWETLSDAVQNTREAAFVPKGNGIVFDISARLVVWLNMAKMNLNDGATTQCSIAAPVALAIQKALFRKLGFDLDPAYQGATAEFIFQGQEAKDATKIFGRYSYSKNATLATFLFYPYDFLSLKYLIRIRMNRNCVDAFTLGTPVDCIVTP